MTTLAPAFQSVPEFLPDQIEHRRKLAQQGNRHNQGKFNAFIDFTLVANVSSSTLTDARIGYFSVIVPMPMTAHAAAEVPTMYVPQATMKSGEAIIQHANNAQTDRSFRFLIIG